MIYLNILLISTILVFILDLSGVVQYWENKLYEWVWNRPAPANYDWTKHPLIKLVSCSLCQSFWWGLIYLLATHNITIPNVAYVCLIAFLTPITKDILLWFKELLQTLTDGLFNLLHK